MDLKPSLRLLFFGKAAELIGSHELNCPYFNTINELSAFLLESYPTLKSVGFVISVNRKIVSNAHLEPNDEVAILPPFSGG
jgi:molybdopterin converting factor small subunit